MENKTQMRVKYRDLKRGDVVGHARRVVRQVNPKSMGFIRVYWYGEDKFTEMPGENEIELHHELKGA